MRGEGCGGGGGGVKRRELSHWIEIDFDFQPAIYQFFIF